VRSTISHISATRRSHEFWRATALRTATLPLPFDRTASDTAAANSDAFPAIDTTPSCRSLNRYTSGNAVETTGSPMARYSFIFVGYTVRV
jgi:hypothetical protein